MWYLFILLFTWFSCNAEIDLTIRSCLKCGFFCEMHKVLDNILHFEDEGFSRVTIEWKQPFFPYKDSPEEDGWPLFFEPISLENKYNSSDTKKITLTGSWYHEIHTNICPRPFLFPERYAQYRLWGHKALTKYIKVKKYILDEVDSFFENNLKDYTCISVHVRYCTAHDREIPGGRGPELKEYYEQVDKIRSNLNTSKIKIYIASDSDYAINQFKKHYPGMVICLEEAFRASYKDDPHLIGDDTNYWVSHPEEFHAKKPGYKGGKEVLMDCLLLAKCDYFIHTASNLATFVIFFNPLLKTIAVPRNMKDGLCSHLRPRQAKYLKPIKNKWHLNL